MYKVFLLSLLTCLWFAWVNRFVRGDDSWMFNYAKARLFPGQVPVLRCAPDRSHPGACDMGFVGRACVLRGLPHMGDSRRGARPSILATCPISTVRANRSPIGWHGCWITPPPWKIVSASSCGSAISFPCIGLLVWLAGLPWTRGLYLVVMFPLIAEICYEVGWKRHNKDLNDLAQYQPHQDRGIADGLLRVGLARDFRLRGPSAINDPP
jgi:hypothetical protein